MTIVGLVQLSHASDAKDRKQQGAVEADTMTARQRMIGAAGSTTYA
jgi:PBP1b-binding outer membrane lipoprotein LpoB